LPELPGASGGGSEGAGGVIQRIAKRRPSRLDAREASRAKEANWRKVTAAVKARDKGQCRLCPVKGHHCHHIEFRSRGGKDVPENLVLLCATCHSDVHAHVIKLAGTASALRIARWDDKSEDFVWTR
jgi:5-methylcytosine-specific restriction endonuclease McrA